MSGNGLKLLLSDGSLMQATFDLLNQAGLGVARKDERSYRLVTKPDNTWLDEVFLMRPQEIPFYVAGGQCDLGVTGEDWVEEQDMAFVVNILNLPISRQEVGQVRVVLAVVENSPIKTVSDITYETKIATEYPNITRRFLRDIVDKWPIIVVPSYGTTEAKAMAGFVDAVVELTETGKTFKQSGMRIVSEIQSFQACLITNPSAYKDKKRRQLIKEVKILIESALAARQKCLLKCNVTSSNMKGVVALLPTAKSPTVSPLSGRKGFALESVVDKSKVAKLLPKLSKAGANAILVCPIMQFVS